MNKLVIISLIFIFYTYLGYPMVLWLLTKMKKERSSTPSFSPAVTVVIAAFNEEESIAKTLNSILESDYPKELLDILVVSDASTDRTDEIVSSYGQGRVRLVRLAHQSGKKKAINSALADVENEIVLVADANSVFIQGTIRSIVRHFADPKVGSSVGSKQIIKRGSSVSAAFPAPPLP